MANVCAERWGRRAVRRVFFPRFHIHGICCYLTFHKSLGWSTSPFFPPNSVIWPGIQLNTASALEQISSQVAISNRVMSRGDPTAGSSSTLTWWRWFQMSFNQNVFIFIDEVGGFFIFRWGLQPLDFDIFNKDFKGWNFKTCARTPWSKSPHGANGCVFRMLNANSFSFSK